MQSILVARRGSGSMFNRDMGSAFHDHRAAARAAVTPMARYSTSSAPVFHMRCTSRASMRTASPGASATVCPPTVIDAAPRRMTKISCMSS